MIIYGAIVMMVGVVSEFAFHSEKVSNPRSRVLMQRLCLQFKSLPSRDTGPVVSSSSVVSSPVSATDWYVFFCSPETLVCHRALGSRRRLIPTEHFDYPVLDGRMLALAQPRSPDLHRSVDDRHRNCDRVLVRLRWRPLRIAVRGN